MTDGPENEPDLTQTITFRGTNIVELDLEQLIEALRETYPEIVALQNRLSEEGRMEAAREEDFQRNVRAQHDYFGTVAEFQSRLFNSSTAYNQLIVIGGLAAFFSIWSSVSKEIDRPVLLASGGLVLVALIIYISWTVIGMFTLQVQNAKTMQTFAEGVEGFEERYRAALASTHQQSSFLMKYWQPVLWSSSLTGFLGAALLGGAALWGVIRQTVNPAQSKLELVSKEFNQMKAAAVKAECNAHIAETYAKADRGEGAFAVNPKTGRKAVLVDNKWIILPKC